MFKSSLSSSLRSSSTGFVANARRRFLYSSCDSRFTIDQNRPGRSPVARRTDVLQWQANYFVIPCLHFAKIQPLDDNDFVLKQSYVRRVITGRELLDWLTRTGPVFTDDELDRMAAANAADRPPRN